MISRHSKTGSQSRVLCVPARWRAPPAARQLTRILVRLVVPARWHHRNECILARLEVCNFIANDPFSLGLAELSQPGHQLTARGMSMMRSFAFMGDVQELVTVNMWLEDFNTLAKVGVPAHKGDESEAGHKPIMVKDIVATL
eukprot:1968551-Pyramimonas_sp.AAC.1